MSTKYDHCSSLIWFVILNSTKESTRSDAEGHTKLMDGQIYGWKVETPIIANSQSRQDVQSIRKKKISEKKKFYQIKKEMHKYNNFSTAQYYTFALSSNILSKAAIKSSSSVHSMCFGPDFITITCKYLHSPTISLDELILDRRGSYTHEQQSFTQHYAQAM